jgi:tetratricopeptide (TPR) repeat protein
MTPTARTDRDSAIASVKSVASRSPWTGSRRGIWLAAAIVVLAGLVAYVNSFSGPFIFDDRLSILENPTIRQLWPLGPVLTPPADGRTVTSRPLFNLSLAVNYSLGETNPWGYHVANLAIHLICGLLLLGVARRTFLLPSMRACYGDAAWELATAIAVLWTVHPLQTESVTYISQRAESLAGLFYLLVLYGVVRGSQSSHGARWYLLAVGACFLGVGVKEPVVTVPVVVLLYDRAFLEDTYKSTLQRRWGLYPGLLASWGFQIYLESRTGFTGVVGQMGSVGVWDYARSQLGVILHYLQLSFWPHPLCLDYAWSVAHTMGEVLPGPIIVGGLGVVTVWGVIKGERWGFLGAWFFLILAPTSSIMPLPHLAFEHRMYLSLAAVVAGVVVGVYNGGRKLVERGWVSVRVVTVGETCAVALATAVLGCLTFARNVTYSSELLVWEDTAANAPHNPEAHYNYGLALAKAGRSREALTQYRRAVELRPGYADAFNNWGSVLLDLNELEQAADQFRQALKIDPKHSGAQNNLGLALVGLGRPQEGMKCFQKAIQLTPSDAGAHANMALALTSLGRGEEAIEWCQKALKCWPDFPRAQFNWGAALASTGRFSQAIEHYQEALRLQPENSEVHYNWGVAAASLDRPAEAIDHYQQALGLDPDFAPAHLNLSSLLARSGRGSEAIEHAKEAARRMTDQPELVSSLAWLIASLGSADTNNKAMAVELAEQACKATGRRDIKLLDTLAAVYAMAGRFADAVATASDAWQEAQAAGQTSLAEDIHMRLQLYRDGKAYRPSSGTQP